MSRRGCVSTKISGPANEKIGLEQNMHVENLLKHGTLRGLTEAEKTEYRRLFREPGESRRSTLTWPQEVPIDAEPADTYEILLRYQQWLPTSSIPKLFMIRY